MSWFAHKLMSSYGFRSPLKSDALLVDARTEISFVPQSCLEAKRVSVSAAGDVGVSEAILE